MAILNVRKPEKILDFFSQEIQQAERIGEERAAREIVICAAVKTEDGQIIRGHRHGDAMMAARERKLKLSKDHEEQQGFITSLNRYVGRKEARTIQDAAGIPSADKDGYRYDILFSEDLY